MEKREEWIVVLLLVSLFVCRNTHSQEDKSENPLRLSDTVAFVFDDYRAEVKVVILSKDNTCVCLIENDDICYRETVRWCWISEKSDWYNGAVYLDWNHPCGVIVRIYEGVPILYWDGVLIRGYIQRFSR